MRHTVDAFAYIFDTEKPVYPFLYYTFALYCVLLVAWHCFALDLSLLTRCSKAGSSNPSSLRFRDSSTCTVSSALRRVSGAYCVCRERYGTILLCETTSHVINYSFVESFFGTRTGRDKGAYYHEIFLRGRPHLAHRIPRVKVKGSGVRKPGAPESEPNLYLRPFLLTSDFNGDATAEEELHTVSKKPHTVIPDGPSSQSGPDVARIAGRALPVGSVAALYANAPPPRPPFPGRPSLHHFLAAQHWSGPPRGFGVPMHNPTMRRFDPTALSPHQLMSLQAALEEDNIRQREALLTSYATFPGRSSEPVAPSASTLQKLSKKFAATSASTAAQDVATLLQLAASLGYR
jgi:hypothetical protein